jgi:beta-mannanase
MAIVRTYYPGLLSSRAWTTGLPAANKSAVIVSFKALPKTILSGQDDAALSHFFDTAPTGNPIYWSYYHEPEGNIADGEFTLADYKAAWAHVVTLARAAHNPDLHSTLILGGYDFRPSAHRNWKDYLPGGGIISTLGWDAYPPAAPRTRSR